MNWKFGFSLLVYAVCPVLAEIQAPMVRLRVDGMVCYVCTSSIEKQCRKQKIGTSFQTHLDKGVVVITLDTRSQLPSPAQFRELVDRAGFTYAGVNLEINGVITREAKDRYRLRLSEVIQETIILPGKYETDLQKHLQKPTHLILAAGPQGPDQWQVVKILSSK